MAGLAAVEALRAAPARGGAPPLVAAAGAAAGLSLGEYAALVFAGVMSFQDGLKVRGTRGYTPSGVRHGARYEGLHHK